MLQLASAQTRLHSGAPWWLVRNGLTDGAASLPRNCDVVVVGAGITGALVADALAEAGLTVVVVDRRLPASGSTAVSTALLQYELDVELVALIELVGEADAVRAYQLSAAAIATLDRITAALPDRCGFARRTSLYLASRRRHARRLRAEAETRDRYGLDVAFVAQVDMAQQYNLPSYGALRTDVAAVVDPVRLARALLGRAVSRGAVVSPWTTALGVETSGRGLSIATDHGSIRADHVVLASGYEIPPGLEPSIMSLHGTFAMITEPVEDAGPLAAGCIVWESARPYTYLRAVDDRIVIGGMDTSHRDADARDALLPGRTKRLERELQRLIPSCTATTSYSWAGTFGETRDGMPMIGPVPGIERVYYALGYGGNGITFSVLAAQILRDLCVGTANDDAHVFRPDR